MLPLLALLLACASDPDACADAACRQAAVLDAWRADPDAAVPLVRALEPLERMSAVNAVMEEDPARAPMLCPLLEPASAVAQCQERAQRGHLFVKPKAPAAATWGPTHAGGVAAVPDVPSALADVAAAAPAHCADKATFPTCTREVALAHARAGEARAALAACRALPDDRLRDDCAFAAAEARLGDAPDRYAAASELCLAAGHFAGQCLGHLARALAAPGPSAAVGDPAAWAPVAAGAEAARARWQGVAPDYAPLAEHAVWSEAMVHAYALVDIVSGDPLDAVPAAAVPHVRASAGALLVQNLPRTAPANRTLDSLVDDLDQALARRVPDDHLARHPRQPIGALELWPTDAPGDARVPAIPYLATSRRTVSADRRVDLTICMLEALARSPLDWSAALEAGEAHPDPAVRWTATRLLAADPARARVGPPGAPPPSATRGSPRSSR